MKRIIVNLLGLTVVLLTGCIINSIYPFYTTKDVTFDPALLGAWASLAATNEVKDTWLFEKIAVQTYKLTLTSSSETNEFDTHLFTLAGERFLDNLSRTRMDYQTPHHFLLWIKSSGPRLELQLMDYEWLAKLLEKEPKTLRHVVVPKKGENTTEGGQLTLTAETAELQKFIRKHLKNTNAWENTVELKKL